MYVISRKIRGTKEILKDSNRDSNKKFSNFSSATTFVKKLNFHIQPDKQWYVENE
ncbi:hypothetical protein GI584_16285 [Gracilibacillus salitolerans]|uniref:Uncharacterized protein n=1 Tax=Gracilibacillus salitolerans TaxID=2663022 RepID=A0A5Q2TN40_9BACI|nr:hypothetical protein [Gracilibacillus salitolerans]QGH35512.1 hypothetical protein GI584_16285 [Gracilibacillus salitolerans]